MAEFPEYAINEVLSGIVFNNLPLVVETDISPPGFSIETEVSASAQLIAIAQPQVDQIEVSVSATAAILHFASATLSSILDISVQSPVSVITVEINALSTSVNLSISDLIRFTPSSRYPGSYIPLLMLDGVALSAQNREFNDSLKTIFVENKNWNNDKSRYYKRTNAGKKSFSLSWEWLPSDREFTVDKREARNYIKNKAVDPDIHTLTMISYGENPEDVFEETSYNVFITNYSEELMRRDLTAGTYFWKCQLELEEI